MSARTEDLAMQFEAASNDAIAFVRSCPDSKWRAAVPNDGRSVGVLAHHLGTGDIPISQLVEVVAKGQPMPPLTREMIDQGNAQHAAQFANVSKDEALAALENNGKQAAALVRGLNDEQLDRTANVLGNQWTAEQVIQNILIGHIRAHLAEMQQTPG
jgi:DinB family protein